jgi:LacI family transcriptional regulator
MAGRQPKHMRKLVPPGRLVARRSTDILTVPHDGVAAALKFIRDHATEPIQVLDVSKHVGVSRSTLDNHFRQVVGRTTHDEIERVRLNIAKSLLENTDWPLRVIAVKSGYRNEQYMCKFFKSKTGRTPGEYRKASHAESAGPAPTR